MKARPRKTRETRAAYRIRKRAEITPRVKRSRTRKAARPAIQWEDRKYATWQELEQWRMWLSDHAPELEAKYSGKYLAIWKNQIIAIGKTWGEAFDNAAMAQPNVGPLIAYIPTEEEAIFAL